ncbi:uncharacterized protein [Parasteatoda tepidariorum]|uniref:uncharacterized protein n=1 Tax=Parasteatoda tepidariorum TaxID=114398 RepID=UPI001C726616|nr:uncharacterized protein LOC107442377 [Parasteatoda tepidariorum]
MKGLHRFFFTFGLFVFIAVQETESEFSEDKAEEYDSILSIFLKDVLENFREDMSEGIPGISVPSLDPFFLSNIDPITIYEGDEIFDLIDLKLRVKDLNITGLSKFHIENLKVDVRKRFFNFSMSIPELMTSGQYNVSGEALEMLRVTNDGSFSFHVKDVHIEGHSHLNMPKSENALLRMTDLNLDLSFGAMEMEFPNLLGNGRYSKWLMKILTSLGKKLFKYFHKEAIREISKELLLLINRQLDRGTFTQLLLG